MTAAELIDDPSAAFRAGRLAVALTAHMQPDVLHDDDHAHAIVDRVPERGRLLTLDEPSMRTRHLDLDDLTATVPSQVARLFGTCAPEFPEPTGENE